MRRPDTRLVDTPGVCILIFAILTSVFAVALAIGALTLATQTREYFCVDMVSSSDSSTASMQFHITTHALTYSLRYRPANPSAQLTLLQILKSGSAVQELCSGAACADLEQTACSNLGEPTHCGAVAGEYLDSDLMRDMRRNPILYSFQATTTDTDMLSIAMGALCSFF